MRHSGHYDILYKTEGVPDSSAVMPTYLQYSSRTHQEPAYDIDVMDFMTGIPGISYAPQHNCWSGSSYSGSDFFSSQGAVQRRVESSASPNTQPQGQSRATCVREDSTQVSTPPEQLSQELVMRAAPHAIASHASSAAQHQLVGGGPFRPSAWELEGDFLSAQSQLPLTTSIFRNSHFNTAHFLNPEFQPEEWRPDDEYIPPRSRNASYKSDE
nr:hypothetical protein CFP56_20452 [Quercus suber]